MSQFKKIQQDSEKIGFFEQVVEQISSVGKIINSAFKSTKEINRSTHMLSTTAKIEANRTGEIGRNFLTVSNSIEELSNKTDKIVDKIDKETIKEIETLSEVVKDKSISIKGEQLTNLALTNIRFVDRNLFERSADVRWWATESSIINALMQETDENKNYLSSRLGTILHYYTVYEDLIVYDLQGNVISNGSSKNTKHNNIKNSTWFQNVLKTTSGKDYSFDIIKEGEGEKQTVNIEFACKIHKNADLSQEVIGILGIIFKWDHFIKDIFDETPLNSEEIKNTGLIILDSEGEILSKSSHLKINLTKNETKTLMEKQKNFQIIIRDNSEITVGYAKSIGYEKFSTGWHSLIIQ